MGILHGDFVDTHRLKGGSAGADCADVQAAQMLHDPANPGKLAQILLKSRVGRVHGHALGQRVWDAALAQHIAHGQLAAQRVPTVGKVHEPDFVRICLHQNGHIGLLQSGRSAVFIAKVGKAQNDAVVFPGVSLEKLGILPALRAGFHSAQMGRVFLHANAVMAAAHHGLRQFPAGACDEFARKKPAISKE